MHQVGVGCYNSKNYKENKYFIGVYIEPVWLGITNRPTLKHYQHCVNTMIN